MVEQRTENPCVPGSNPGSTTQAESIADKIDSAFLFLKKFSLYLYIMKISIIGSGFASLSAAAVLAKNGYNVTVIEKNSDLGGRARQFQQNDFLFDMGPSWYWMPDVFEKFFNYFNKSVKDYYQLVKLDPGFQMIFNNYETIPISASFQEIKKVFEEIEPGASKVLEEFMQEAKFKYQFSMDKLIYNPGLSFFEFVNKGIFQNIFNLELFKSYQSHVYTKFTNTKLRALLEFPVLFLGTAPKDTPALYSLMAYSGFVQGTFYPVGGFFAVIKGMVSLCEELGVKFIKNETVTKIHISNNLATGLTTNRNNYKSDIVIAGADYEHVESKLIEKKYRNYSTNYWNKKTFSPSCLLFYLGINKKLKKIIHHNLFFDADIEQHIKNIYSEKVWPKDPLFYVCCPSKTDPNVAPKNKENIFLLIPISPDSKDSEEIREYYFNLIIKRLEEYCGEIITDFIEYKRSYCVADFKQDYNAFKGNAYGLANTLFQTANFKPSIKNKKVRNLFYTGQLTVPGPGVPPALISGQIVGQAIIKQFH